MAHVKFSLPGPSAAAPAADATPMAGPESITVHVPSEKAETGRLEGFRIGNVRKASSSKIIHVSGSCAIVDGRNPANQLRLVVYPIIYKSFFYIPGSQISEPSTVCEPERNKLVIYGT